MQGLSSSGFDLDRLRRSEWILHVEFHRSLPSTSTTALELLPQLLSTAPALVLVDQQTAGRGLKGNAWWSSAGALTFSVIIDPLVSGIAPERRSLMSVASALAVRDAISRVVPDRIVQLKWPNDVYVGTQKLCGILAEQHSVQQPGVQQPGVQQPGVPGRQGVIIGVGVNVNNSLADAPSEVQLRAASLFDLQHQSFDMTSILEEILQQLPRRLHQISRQLPGLLAEANRYHLLKGCTITVQLPESQLTGHCIGIDEDGCLVLNTDRGIRRLSSGVVMNWQ